MIRIMNYFKSCLSYLYTVKNGHKASLTKQIWSMSLLAGLMMGACSVTQADSLTHQMSLTHHEFEDWTFTPRAKDTIDIINRSDISHSIYVTYPDGTVVNLGVQLPGETVSWTIPESGEFLLQCWIHPVIRATLTVAP
ncbi:MAG: hypothetical protein Kow0083_14330 [Methylophaga sp.]